MDRSIFGLLFYKLQNWEIKFGIEHHTSIMRLNEAPVFFSSVLRPKHPQDSHLDTFNQMLPVMRNSIAGSVDGLCLNAIARNLMTFPEQAGILEGGNKFKHASRFLEHFALIEDRSVTRGLVSIHGHAD